VSNAKREWPRSFVKVKRPSDKHFSIYSSEGEFTVRQEDGRWHSPSEVTKLQTSTLATED